MTRALETWCQTSQVVQRRNILHTHRVDYAAQFVPLGLTFLPTGYVLKGCFSSAKLRKSSIFNKTKFIFPGKIF